MGGMHVKKGDIVVVLKGKDKDKQGKILKVDPERQRVVVEGIARAKKHVRPSQANPQGGVVDWEMPIDASNVMLVCPGCGRPTRTNKLRGEGKAPMRVCKKCGREM
jgi:large subunit ribosomal protein L24